MKTSIMRGVSIAIAVGVLTTMLASITLLPALLGFVGRNIDKWKIGRHKHAEAGDTQSGWYRWSRVIQRRPWPRPDHRVSSCSCCSRCRCCRCGSGSPTPGTGRRATPRAARTTSSPRGSGPASTVRCCSRPRRRTGSRTSPRCSKLSDTLNDGVRRRRVRDAAADQPSRATSRSCRCSPPRTRRTRRPPISSAGCATT